MAVSIKDAVVLKLQRVDELFNPPAVNPFSAREVEILGEAGIERLRKRVLQRWPQKPRPSRLILQLPPDQISPATAAEVSAAIRRFCAAQIGHNRVRRHGVVAVGLRQLAFACVILIVVLPIVYWLVNSPAGLLPSFWRGMLAMLALFAGLVALWEAIRSLAFDWIPFVQNVAGYRYITALDVIVEAQPAEP